MSGWLGRNKSENKEDGAGGQEKIPSIYRGPGFYEHDLNKIFEKFDSLGKQISAGGNTDVLEKMIIDLNSKLDTTSECVLKIIQDITEFGNDLDGLIKKGSGANLKDVKSLFSNMENHITTQLKGVSEQIANGLSGANGSPVVQTPPPPKVSAPPAPPKRVYTKQLMSQRFGEARDYFGNELEYDIRDWSVLNEKDQEICKITKKEQKSKQKLMFALCSEQGDRKADLLFINETAQRLKKLYIEEKEKAGFWTLIVLTHPNFEYFKRDTTNWLNQGVAVFPFEAVYFLIGLWMKHEADSFTFFNLDEKKRQQTAEPKTEPKTESLPVTEPVQNTETSETKNFDIPESIADLGLNKVSTDQNDESKNDFAPAESAGNLELPAEDQTEEVEGDENDEPVEEESGRYELQED